MTARMPFKTPSFLKSGISTITSHTSETMDKIYNYCASHNAQLFIDKVSDEKELTIEIIEKL